MKRVVLLSAFVICSLSGYSQKWGDAIYPLAKALQAISENPKTYDLADRVIAIVEREQIDSEEVEALEDEHQALKEKNKILRQKRRLLRNQLKTERLRLKYEKKFSNLKRKKP